MQLLVRRYEYSGGMAPKSHDNFVLQITKLSSQKRIGLGLNAFIFLIGFIALLGIFLHIPMLYYYSKGGIAFDFRVGWALILLSLGYFITVIPLLTNKKTFKNLMIPVIYLIPLIIASSQIIVFFRVYKQVSLEQFLIPESPISGHMPLFEALGLLLSSIISLVSYYCPTHSVKGSLWGVQMPTILLINLSAFGLIGDLGPEPLAHYLMTMPVSIALLFYGAALLLSQSGCPISLAKPFFASLQTRFLAIILCLGWLGSVVWHTLGWETYIGPQELSIGTVRNLVISNGFFQVAFSSAFLAFGLYVLLNLEIYETLMNKLQDTLESLGILAAALSHDLKGPLKSAIYAIELLQKSELGDNLSTTENQNLLSALNESTRFELELVLNLVELLRSQNKQERFEPTHFKLNHFLQEIKEELAPLSSFKKQSLTIHLLPEEQQDIVADRFSLKRALENLMTNAIQNTGEGAHIDVDVQPQDNDFIFRVKDDGPGIPRELQEKLLHPGNGKRKLPSTKGLGLYITKQIVTKHGGKLGLKSVPGQGSTFFFNIPKAKQNQLRRNQFA